MVSIGRQTGQHHNPTPIQHHQIGCGQHSAFHCSRVFKSPPDDKFECEVINYADPYGKVLLEIIDIKGHNVWLGEHPRAPGADKVDYVADEAYEVTPMHQRFADAVIRFPASCLNP